MAEPNILMRGTKFSQGTETSLVRDVADKIYLLQPDDAPLLTFINGLKNKKVANNPKFEWFEDELLPNVVADSGGSGAGSPINVAAGTGVRVRVGDILIPSSGEAILVTSILADALTVTRSMGAVAAQVLVDGDQMVIAGNALAEGGTYAPVRSTQKTAVTNYIQIFKDTVQLTDVQNASESYGGDDRTYQRRKKAIEHKRGIEQAFLFGDGFENTAGDQAIRGTMGLLNYIKTNIQDAGGIITESEFETFCRTIFRYQPAVNSSEKLLIACPMLISAVNFWAKNALQVSSDEKTFGVRVTKYRSGHGDLNIVRHWLLQDFTEFQKYAFCVDPQNLQYRFLPGLDTKLYTDTQHKSDGFVMDEYRTYCGLQVMQEKTHGLLKGITGFAA